MLYQSDNLRGFFASGLIFASLTPLFSAGFTDVTERAGVFYEQEGEVDTELETHHQAGGVVAADFDGDGWTDLFVTRMGAADILFRNQGPDGDGSVAFENVAGSAGFTEVTNTNGAVAADIDNDGDLDLYVSTVYERRFILYINDGSGRFVREEGISGTALQSVNDHLGFSVSAGDFNRDGWIDLHTNEWNIDLGVDDIEKHSALLRNIGADNPGRFINSTEEAGVELTGSLQRPDQPIQYAFSSAFADLDGDGWQDLVVAADFESGQLFWNNQDGTFEEGTQAAGFGLARNGMGLATGDFDGDGLLDLFVSSISDHRLYRNRGDRTFEEVSSRVENRSGWGWGSSFFDYDNDGSLDLVMASGYEDSAVRSLSPTMLWRNVGGFFFETGPFLGIDDEGSGKGVAVFDYDQDGDLDLFVAHNQGGPTLYRNDVVNLNNWLRVRLVGRKSNRFGIGARLHLKKSAASQPQLVELTGGSNFVSQNEQIAHFGLGRQLGDVHSLVVHWPSGVEQELRDLEADRLYTVFEPTNYESWRSSVFSEVELDDPFLSEPGSDADGDGYSNLREYAFGTGALDPYSNSSYVSLERSRDEYTLRYDRLANARDLRYAYEYSDDLANWVALSEGEVEARVEASFGEVERVAVELVAAQTHPVYFRVRVELVDETGL